jgi:hypothetical protein
MKIIFFVDKVLSGILIVTYYDCMVIIFSCLVCFPEFEIALRVESIYKGALGGASLVKRRNECTRWEMYLERELRLVLTKQLLSSRA